MRLYLQDEADSRSGVHFSLLSVYLLDRIQYLCHLNENQVKTLPPRH